MKLLKIATKEIESRAGNPLSHERRFQFHAGLSREEKTAQAHNKTIE